MAESIDKLIHEIIEERDKRLTKKIEKLTPSKLKKTKSKDPNSQNNNQKNQEQ